MTIVDRKTKAEVTDKLPFYAVPDDAKDERGEHVCELSITNPHDEPVYFKILSNSKTMHKEERFIVNPSEGVLTGKGEDFNVQLVARDEHKPGVDSVPIKNKTVTDTFRLQFVKLGKEAEPTLTAGLARWAEVNKMPKETLKKTIATAKLVAVIVEAELDAAKTDGGFYKAGEEDDDSEDEEEDTDDAGPDAAKAAAEPELVGVDEDDKKHWVLVRSKGCIVVTKKEKGAAGDGCTFPANGDRVMVNYTARLRTGAEFDGEHGPGKPMLVFQIGSGSVPPGFESGVRQMSQGESAEVSVSAEQGYGSKGRTGVPADSDLIVNVQLVGVRSRSRRPLWQSPSSLTLSASKSSRLSTRSTMPKRLPRRSRTVWRSTRRTSRRWCGF